MTEILGLSFLALQTLLVRVEYDVVVADAPRDVFLFAEIDCLWDVMDVLDIASLFELVAELNRILLAHAIEDHIGTAVAEDALHQPVLPVIVVGEPSHGRLDAAQDHGHVGKKLLQDLGVDDAGIVRSHIMAGIRTVGIVVAHAPVGRVAVDHRVHGTGRHSKEEPWASEFLEVAVVAMPVGLRYDRHFIALCLKEPADDSRAKRRMVDIGIAGKENHVEFIPPTQLAFLAGGGEEVCQLIFLRHIGIMCQSCCLVVDVLWIVVVFCWLGSFPLLVGIDKLLEAKSLHVVVVDDIQAKIEQVVVLYSL